MSVFDEIRAELGEGSASIAEVLTEIEAVCDTLPSHFWIEPRTRSPGVAINVYLISPGTLHRVFGNQDAVRDTNKPDDPICSACEYRVVPITHRARLASETTLSRQPTRERARCRRTFDLGGGDKLTFALPEDGVGDEDGLVDIKVVRADLEKFKGFAGAFTREIIAAQARAD